MKRRPTTADGHENLERWLLTYADMITLLTAFFLMMYSMSVMSKGKFTAVAQSVRSGFNTSATENSGSSASQAAESDFAKALKGLLTFADEQKLDGKVRVSHDDRGTVISLTSDKLLFNIGQAKVNPRAFPLLNRVGKLLTTVPNNVVIEGHTCNLPINTPMFPSNWELSTARAGSILRFFTARGNLKSGRFRAAGCADTRPIVPNTSEKNRARNRRVDIILEKTDTQHESDYLRKQETQRILVKPDAPASTEIGSGTTTTGGNTDTKLTPEPDNKVSNTGGAQDGGHNSAEATVMEP